MEEEIDAEIKAAVQRAEAMAKSEELSDPLLMFDYLYADIPPFLMQQRNELEKHLNKNKKLKHEAGEKKSPSPAQI